MRKHAATLMELLIAIGLLSILCSFLFGYYYRVNTLQHNIDTLKDEISKQGEMNDWLKRVFAKVVPFGEEEVQATPLDKKKRTGNFFFTDSPLPGQSDCSSLVFTYANDPDPYANYFSGHVLARLYLNLQHQLCLAFWPPLGSWNMDEFPYRQEVLAEGIDHLSFSFYYPKIYEENDAPAIIGKKEEPEVGIHPQWKEKYRRLPAIVYVHLTFKKEEDHLSSPLTLAYVLQGSDLFVTFPRDKTF